MTDTPLLRLARIVDRWFNVDELDVEALRVEAASLVRDLEAAPPEPARRTITRTQYEWAVTHAANWTQIPANVLVQDLLAAWRLTLEDA